MAGQQRVLACTAATLIGATRIRPVGAHRPGRLFLSGQARDEAASAALAGAVPGPALDIRYHKGARRVLLISGNPVGERVVQHSTEIPAAKAEGADVDAYPGIANAADDPTDMLTGAGVPEAFAEILADPDPGIAHGDLLVT